MGKSWSNLKDYDFDGTKLTIFVGLKVGKINTYRKVSNTNRGFYLSF